MLSNDGEEKWKYQLSLFELIEIMDGYTNVQTHTRLRATCKHFCQFLPLEKVVNFKTLKELVEKFHIRGCKDREGESGRYFQDQVHLDISPNTLTQEQYEYLSSGKCLKFETCRVSRAVLDNPLTYKHIDLLNYHCYSLVAAARIGDVDLMARLPIIPKMDPTASYNWPIRIAAMNGQLESLRFLLNLQKVDRRVHLYYSNGVLREASNNNHIEVCSLLLTDPSALAVYLEHPFAPPAGVIIPSLAPPPSCTPHV